jgi:hypothetical protein
VAKRSTVAKRTTRGKSPKRASARMS